MPVTRSNTMPMATCPHCNQEFQWHDYYDVNNGDDRECPKCERAIHVVAKECVMYLDLSTAPEGHNAEL